MKTLIVIPARYHSTRFPGKPLALIAGRPMLDRVVAVARATARQQPGTEYVVATDHEKILKHCKAQDIPAVITPESCATGTDRVQAAVKTLNSNHDLILNLQGDAPMTPSDFLVRMIKAYQTSPVDVVTPVSQLTWEQFDHLKKSKEKTPFSGTTALFHSATGRAFWFSKNILPAIRKEEELRRVGPLSPVFQHIGLYGYSRKMLDIYVTLRPGYYESLEGLEQLRVLEHGYHIVCVPVERAGDHSQAGVDSPEDVIRVEAFIKKYGEPR